MIDAMNDTRPSSVHGILLFVASELLLLVMFSLVKSVINYVEPAQAVLFRSALAFPTILLWIKLDSGKNTKEVRFKRLELHLTRGILAGMGLLAGFYALRTLPLSDITVIGFAQPVIAMIFAIVLLREPVRRHRVLSMLGTLAGVALVAGQWLPKRADHALTDRAFLGLLAEFCSITFIAASQVLTASFRTAGLSD